MFCSKVLFPATFHMFWIAFYGAFQLCFTLYLDTTWSWFYWLQWFTPVWFCRQCRAQSSSLLNWRTQCRAHSSSLTDVMAYCHWICHSSSQLERMVIIICKSIITSMRTDFSWLKKVLQRPKLLVLSGTQVTKKKGTSNNLWQLPQKFSYKDKIIFHNS